MSVFVTRPHNGRIAIKVLLLAMILLPSLAAAGQNEAPRLYVLEPGLNQVQVVETGSRGFPDTVTATIAVGDIAVQAKATPDEKFVWVPNGGDGTVTIIRTADNNTQLISTSSPGEVACSPNNFPTPCSFPGPAVFGRNGALAYLVDAGDNTLKVIGSESGKILNVIPVGNFPAGIAITPDGGKIYVTNLIDNTVSVISATTQSLVATIAMPPSTYKGSVPPACVSSGTTLSGPSPTSIAITPDGKFVYVTNAYDDALLPTCPPFQPSTISVIRVADNTVIHPAQTIRSGGYLATAINFLPARSFDRGIALVANTGTDNYPDHRIGAVDTALQSLIKVTSEPSPIIGPSEIDPVRRLVYVPNIGNGTAGPPPIYGGESIVTLNSATLGVSHIFALPAGSFPSSIAVIGGCAR